jgi:hypothetical protein
MQTTILDSSKPLSTGPITPEGKAISSRNALKHGCCSTEMVLLPTDNLDDYKALESIWLKAYAPSDETERHLVHELVNADWMLQRAVSTHAKIEAGLFAANPNPVEWTEAQDRKLGRFLRYKTAHTNNVIKLKKSIEDYRKARAVEKTNAQKLSLAQERLKTQQRKNQPESWKEHLEGMRQKAIALGFTPPERPLDPTKR